MKLTSRPQFAVVACLLVLLVLVTGCYKEVAPDVESTPTGETAGGLSQEDVMATAIARTTRVAQELGGEAGEGTPVATEPPAVALPTLVPTEPAPIITAAPTFTPAAIVPTQASASQAGSSGQTTHVVQNGENLFRIALNYGTTVQAITSANGIANPSQIQVGQQLVIPGTAPEPSSPSDGSTYVVQPGDNLFRIALRYNLNYLYLAQYNGISNPSNVYVGQVIHIPSE